MHFRLQRGRYAAQMELASRYWGVRAARCRFWGCGRSSPLSSAAWLRERTRSLEQMCWDRCCHIHWTLRMDCCLHRAELHSNCIEGIQLYLVVFLRWAIHPYRHIRRLFCTVPSGLLVAAAACWPAGGIDPVRRGDRPHRGKNVG